MYNLYEVICIIEPTVSVSDIKVYIDKMTDVVKKKMV
jgi:ribosomal protein S6